MKFLLLSLVLIVASGDASNVTHKLTCQLPVADVPQEWITMVDPCIKKLSEQVQAELNAAMTYMAMGAHFSRDSINRPGFAKMFFASASEEREHAIKILEYLLMRGELTEDVRSLIQNPVSTTFTWKDAVTALKDALKLEASVTVRIRDIIKVCEESRLNTANDVEFNDYHLVDYLTADFLEEQYTGQRAIAGHISTLGKLMDSHGAIGEFLFDKRLLE